MNVNICLDVLDSQGKEKTVVENDFIIFSFFSLVHCVIFKIQLSSKLSKNGLHDFQMEVYEPRIHPAAL